LFRNQNLCPFAERNYFLLIVLLAQGRGLLLRELGKVGTSQKILIVGLLLGTGLDLGALLSGTLWKTIPLVTLQVAEKTHVKKKRTLA
jgi:hypothetical protein